MGPTATFSVLIAPLVAAGFVAPAIGGESEASGRSEAWTWCIRADPTTISADQSIAGCSAILAAALDTQENLTVAANNRALAYLSKGDYSRAIKDFDQVLRQKPDDVEALNSRATAFGSSGDNFAAIRDSERAMRLRPDDERAYYNRGTAYSNVADYGRAIEDFDQAIRLKPSFAFALNNRCWTRALANVALDTALADCNEALRLTQGNEHILDSRAFVFFRLKRYADAIEDCNQVLRKFPHSAACLYVRGLSRIRIGERNKGDVDIASARAVNPNIGDTYAKFGVLP